jgi:type IV secretory pathway TrbL component
MKYGRYGGIQWFLLDYGLVMLIAANILKYWATPCPLLAGYSVSGFIPGVCEYYAELIGRQMMDVVFTQGGVVLKAISMQKIGIDWAMIPVAWIAKILIWIIEAIVFIPTALSIVMIGVIRLIGPLMVPFMIFPATKFMFWGVVQSLLQYSLLRVAAQALIFVMGSAFVAFLTNVLGGNYTLASFDVNMAKLVVITALGAFLAFRLEAIVGDIARGAASATSGAFGAGARAVASVSALM